MSASVKIMLSYNYCHFEICIGEDGFITNEDIDNMRKDAQRLADKAVKQYKIAKKEAQNKINLSMGFSQIEQEVKIIMENYPQSEWNEKQKATIKAYEDLRYRQNRIYDYEDDWEYEDE
jgi:hypothetical protein